MDFENIKISGADISVIGIAFISKRSNFQLFHQLGFKSEPGFGDSGPTNGQNKRMA